MAPGIAGLAPGGPRQHRLAPDQHRVGSGSPRATPGTSGRHRISSGSVPGASGRLRTGTESGPGGTGWVPAAPARADRPGGNFSRKPFRTPSIHYIGLPNSPPSLYIVGAGTLVKSSKNRFTDNYISALVQKYSKLQKMDHFRFFSKEF